MLKVEHSEQETDRQRYEDEASGCGDRSGRSAHLRSHAGPRRHAAGVMTALIIAMPNLTMRVDQDWPSSTRDQ